MKYCEVMIELRVHKDVMCVYINYKNRSFNTQPCNDIVCCEVSCGDTYRIST